jgi:hypothetical protein
MLGIRLLKDTREKCLYRVRHAALQNPLPQGGLTL